VEIKSHALKTLALVTCVSFTSLPLHRTVCMRRWRIQIHVVARRRNRVAYPTTSHYRPSRTKTEKSRVPHNQSLPTRSYEDRTESCTPQPVTTDQVARRPNRVVYSTTSHYRPSRTKTEQSRVLHNQSLPTKSHEDRTESCTPQPVTTDRAIHVHFCLPVWCPLTFTGKNLASPTSS
jgi:hypothetical protein